MKKSLKILLIVASILILVGFVCMLVAAGSYNFKMYEMFNQEYKSQVFVLENIENLTNLELNQEAYNITFYVAEDNVLRIEYPVMDNVVHTYEVSEDYVLRNSILDNRKWYEDLNLVFNKTPEVKIYLPQKQYKALIIKSTSGDVSLTKEISFAYCEISTTSGDIDFSHSGMNEMNLSTTSGDIHFNSVRGGSANIKSVSGDIKMSNNTNTTAFAYCTSGEISISDSIFKRLNAKTTSGDILAYKTHATDWIGFNSTSGDIEIYDMRCSELHYISVSGDIDFDMVENSGFLEIQTTSGDIEGNLRRATRFTVETTSGNSVVDGNNNNSDFLCSVKTVSGDINIKAPC